MFWDGMPLAQKTASSKRCIWEGDPNNEIYRVSGVVLHFIRIARWMYSAGKSPHNLPTTRGL
jgi:hypothetical protein